jgi:hypothetical protein
MSLPTSNSSSEPPANHTFALQDKLPKLPIPPLEETCNRYLRALLALQDEKEHETTKAAVYEFLRTDGPKLQAMLKEYAQDKQRCERNPSRPLLIPLNTPIFKLHRRVLVRVLPFSQRPRRACSESVFRLGVCSSLVIIPPKVSL